MMPRLRSVLIFLALACPLFAAEKAVVFDFQPLGVDTGYTRTIALLLRGRLSELSVYDMVDPAPGTEAFTTGDALAAATALGANRAVTGSIARIGSKYIISYRLVSVPDGRVELSDRTSTTSIEDLDFVSDRIARAIKDRRPFGATLEAGEATTIERGRSMALSSFYLMTGYTFLLDRRFAYDPGSMLFTLDAAVSYETPDILTQGLMGWRFGKNGYDEIYFDLLVHKVFSRMDITPYIGGGVGIHSYRFRPDYPLKAKDYDGLAFTASGGVILFRTQYFRIATGLKGSLALSDDFTDAAGNSFVLPSVSLNFGLTSPTVGPGGSLDVPPPAVYTCLGAFFLTGLIVALSSR
jgi:hypothetical protein